MQILVKHIMQSPVVSLFPEQSLPLADEIMRTRNVHHLPVIDDASRLVGMVSDRDIIGAQISSLTPIDATERRALHDRTKVSQIMTTAVWTAGEDMAAATAGRLLMEHRFSCLPVIDNAGVLIGIVTERDFMRLAVDALDGDSAPR